MGRHSWNILVILLAFGPSLKISAPAGTLDEMGVLTTSAERGVAILADPSDPTVVRVVAGLARLLGPRMEQVVPEPKERRETQLSAAKSRGVRILIALGSGGIRAAAETAWPHRVVASGPNAVHASVPRDQRTTWIELPWPDLRGEIAAIASEVYGREVQIYVPHRGHRNGESVPPQFESAVWEPPKIPSMPSTCRAVGLIEGTSSLAELETLLSAFRERGVPVFADSEFLARSGATVAVTLDAEFAALWIAAMAVSDQSKPSSLNSKLWLNVEAAKRTGMVLPLRVLARCDEVPSESALGPVK